MLDVYQTCRRFSQRQSLICESSIIKLALKPALETTKWSTVLLFLLASNILELKVLGYFYCGLPLESRKGLWGELWGIVSEIIGTDAGKRMHGMVVTVLQLTLLKEIRTVSLPGKPHIIGF